MAKFSLLADQENYKTTDPDLQNDLEARQYWFDLFEKHFEKVLDAAAVAYGQRAGKRIESAREQFQNLLSLLRENPTDVENILPDPPAQAVAEKPFGVMELCRLREKVLRENGLDDPFRHVKQRENTAALQAYPDAISRVGSFATADRWEYLIRCIFAGNIFDLGSVATLDFATDMVDFPKALNQIKPRPWLIDDFDKLKEILPQDAVSPAPWAKIVVFVDNAGADFVLGVIPFVRELAAHGTQIVLAANELPSLNDITADEAIDLLERIAQMDEKLASYISAGLFEVVSTGNDVPLINLGEVSDELNAAAADADLVILEGMGRSVESNLDATFTVDSIYLCLLKDPFIAKRLGGELFDCVCMYKSKK